MNADAPQQIPLPSGRAPAGHLVTARSYLIDRFVPACEIIALPEKEVAGGTLRCRRGQLDLPAVPPSGRLSRIRARLSQPAPQRVDDGVLFDLRHHDPRNWAHVLNNHLPLVFRLCEEFGVASSEARLVLPGEAPGYVRAAADLFGLEVLATDGPVSGEGVAFEVAPWTAVRPSRAEWARLPRAAGPVARAVAEGERPLPARVFLSRRDTRRLTNEAEISAWLAERGFETLYPETLSAAEQIRLFQEAEAIVAIHGAALAPLLYAPPEGRLRRLVEILPVGHMTDVYRVMAGQVGVDWIGVRGRIAPRHVAPAYRLGAGFGMFSLEDFEADIAALEIAFEKIGMPPPM